MEARINNESNQTIKEIASLNHKESWAEHNKLLETEMRINEEILMFTKNSKARTENGTTNNGATKTGENRKR